MDRKPRAEGQFHDGPVDPCRVVARRARPALFQIALAGNDVAWHWLVGMSNVEIAKPLTRAINIYRKMVRHDLDRQTCRAVARHIKGLAEQGLQDPGRLTVHGLSYLRKLDRQAAKR